MSRPTQVGAAPEDIPVVVYNEFADDFWKLSPEAREEFDEVFGRLQHHAYEPSLQRKFILHEDEIYEYRFVDGHSIFWRMERVHGVDTIVVIGIEPPSTW